MRTYRFGGPSRQAQFRPRANQQRENGGGFPFMQLLPFLFLFLMTMSGSIFDLFTTPEPSYTWNQYGKYSTLRHTSDRKVPYYVSRNEFANWKPTNSKMRSFEATVESQFARGLYRECERENMQRSYAMNEAVGWFSTDNEALERARKMPMPNCERYQEYGFGYR